MYVEEEFTDVLSYYDEAGTILTVSNSNDDVGNYIEIFYETFTDPNEGNLIFP